MAGRVRDEIVPEGDPLIDLHILEGPLAGQRVKLDPDEPLLIGRSKQGVHLVDPTVSLEHAEIAWETDAYWLVDLRSRTGTFVDGAPIGGAPVRLRNAMEIVVGDSLFLVEQRLIRPAWAVPVTLASFAVIAACLLLSYAWTRPVTYEPTLQLPAPLSIAGNKTRVLDIPMPFIRRVGRDHRQLRVRRITDFDENGTSELWLTGGDREWIITFEPGGEWRELGEIPTGCRDLAAETLPVLRCNNFVYQYFDDDNGYRVVSQDGVIALIREQPAVAIRKKGKQWTPPPEDQHLRLLPFTANLTQTDQLATFLSQRGVNEAVHYLICEGAFEGVRSQVLTESGRLIPLPVGCISSIAVSGTYEPGAVGKEVLAVAFSATGYSALLDDVAMTLAGNTEGLLVPDSAQGILNEIGSEPARVGSVLVSFTEPGPKVRFHPIADERPVPGKRQLVPTDEWVPPVPTSIVDLPGPGRYRIDLPGCHDLLVVTNDWTCAMTKWCSEGSDFMSVRQTGCERNEQVAHIGYEAGQRTGKVDGIKVQIDVDGAPGSRRFDVLRARIAYSLGP